MALKIKFRVLLTQCGEPIENGELIIKEGQIVAISPVEGEAEETHVRVRLDREHGLLRRDERAPRRQPTRWNC